MRDFLIRILSTFQSRGTDNARRATEAVGEAAERVNQKAEAGRWARFWTSFQQGARRSGQAVAGLVRQMRLLVGVGVVGALALITRRMARLAEETTRASQVTGLSVRQWQQLDRVARGLNVTTSDLEGGLRRMNRRVADMEQDFLAAGIQTRDANGEFRESIDIFLEVTDVISGMSSAHDRAALSQRLMGEGGQRLLPLLRQGSAAIREQMENTRVMADESIRHLQAAQQSWTDFIDEITIGTSRAIPYINETIAAFRRLGGTPLTAAHADQTRDFREAIADLGLELRDVLGRPIEGNVLSREIDRMIRGQDTLRINAEAAQKIEERAAQIGLERATQQRDEADRKREAAEAEAEAAAQERERNRIAEARRVLAEGEAERVREQMTAQEQLAALEERFSDLRARAHEGDVAAANEFNRLKAEEVRLRNQIKDTATGQREQEKAAREGLETELEILRARAAGEEERASQLENQRALRRETQQIMEQTGHTEAEAARIAREKLGYERQIAEAKRGAKQEAEELTAEERRRRELLEKAARDPHGRGLEGRRAIRELQDMGEISTTQRVAQEQLLSLQARRQRGQDIFDRPSTATQGPPSPQVVPLHREPFPSSERLPAAGGDDRRITQAGERISGAVQEHQEAVLQVLDELLRQLTANRRQIETLKTQMAAGRN